MNMYRMSVAAIAMAFTAGVAQAATVSLNYDVPTPAGDVRAPSATTGDVRLNFVGNDLSNPAPNSRSPWDGTAFVNSGQYHSVSAGASLTYDFDVDQTNFGLMWGSPDSYNDLVFKLDDAVVFSLTGTDVDNPPAPGAGFVNVRISDLLFDQVIFTSGNSDAFEFAQVQVPLPAAIWLMLGAIGGLGFVSRRRSAAAA
ncbi:VPLPA-CTERM sorting domain-containing protein [Pikeienuella piscinae]|uniref:VPLPA-CTERM sorting domain-containing protein n=1 Tax=Pikeienuella piscinae TaxID=2748098 RepID=A0A7M3T616_9RHOB|nr:VPLPA-CTERM sorting domain-containing protein [Pikeienuella piscinae]QIE57447.1 VPLPA-CTERM sorting domain-containing protein [Pikeienuella piscinae]